MNKRAAKRKFYSTFWKNSASYTTNGQLMLVDFDSSAEVILSSKFNHFASKARISDEQLDLLRDKGFVAV